MMNMRIWNRFETMINICIAYVIYKIVLGELYSIRGSFGRLRLVIRIMSRKTKVKHIFPNYVCHGIATTARLNSIL